MGPSSLALTVSPADTTHHGHAVHHGIPSVDMADALLRFRVPVSSAPPEVPHDETDVPRALARTAHDFNNLLGVCLGFSELADGELSELQPRLLTVAQKLAALAILLNNSALDALAGTVEGFAGDVQHVRGRLSESLTAMHHMTDTNRSILNAASGRTVKEPVSLQAIAKVAGSLLEGKARARNVTINHDFGRDGNKPLAVMGVHADLLHALVNLIKNAIDAMPAGGDEKGELRVTLILERDGDHAVLRVKDNAGGIPQDRQAAIFADFNSTKGGHGYGLGLGSAVERIRQNDGELSLESEPGKGTTFTLRFPAYVPPPPKEAATPQGEDAFEGAGVPARR